MRQLAAFTKKEFIELSRTNKTMILMIIFIIFGIMSPLMAKLTPWMFEMLSGTLKEQGITIGDISVTAITSWEQYYKNLFMEFVVFVVMLSGILTGEYEKGTLVNMVTKGLTRWKIIAAKGIALVFTWSLCHYLCYAITYAYNAFFWDNSIANHVFFASTASYIFGLWLISIILLSSAYLGTSSGVLLTTAIVYGATYLLAMIPDLSNYLPTKLTSGLELIRVLQ